MGGRSSCSEAFFGRQQYLRCSGPCGARFHCKCIDVVGSDYEFFVAGGWSTYESQDGTRRNGAQDVAVDAEDYSEEFPALHNNGKQTAPVAESCDRSGYVNKFLSILLEKIDRLSWKMFCLPGKITRPCRCNSPGTPNCTTVWVRHNILGSRPTTQNVVPVLFATGFLTATFATATFATAAGKQPTSRAIPHETSRNTNDQNIDLVHPESAELAWATRRPSPQTTGNNVLADADGFMLF